MKKVLSEVSSCFPGVPIKRLYKQYKNKEGKKEQESLPETSKEEKDDTKAKHGKDCFNKHKKREQKERMKRKISIESDELIEKQQKKVPRTNEMKEKKKMIEKSLTVENKNDSSGSRKKRRREEEKKVSNEQNVKRKSSRLQYRSENDKNKKESKPEDNQAESSKRKKRKTVEDVTPKQLVEKEEKSEDSRLSLDEKRNPDKRDLLWTEKYQPDCSSEVMGNASSVSRLRSWLEAWKIKREKTLRKELEMQKR